MGKASLNLIKISELSAFRAVRQEGLDGGSVWMRGVAWGGGGASLNLTKNTLSGQSGGFGWGVGVGVWGGGGKGFIEFPSKLHLSARDSVSLKFQNFQLSEQSGRRVWGAGRFGGGGGWERLH